MAKLNTGMVSVTFRKYSVDEVVAATVKAGLEGIEWGGDIHVPVGDYAAAEHAAKLCSDNGLKIYSYGSYYRAGMGQHFTPVIETAKALGALNVRVWAGSYGSETTPDNRMAVTADLKRICKKAAKRGINVSVEFHQGTLTDEAPSALLLAKEVDEPNFSLYWQPNQFRTFEDNIFALETVMPYLSSVHVFSWTGNNRYPLRNHDKQWKVYTDYLMKNEKDHTMLLEFSCDDSESAFLDDAEYLKTLVNG